MAPEPGQSALPRSHASPTSDAMAWLQHRVRRSRRPTAQSQDISSYAEDVFSTSGHRTVSTPLEASVLNGDQSSQQLTVERDSILQHSTPVSSSRTTPNYRRASMMPTPSPLQTPLLYRRSSMQVGPQRMPSEESIPALSPAPIRGTSLLTLQVAP